jgi:hypothetical protein
MPRWEVSVVNVIWGILDFLEKYNGAVTAVATVFIGIFTYVCLT